MSIWNEIKLSTAIASTMQTPHHMQRKHATSQCTCMATETLDVATFHSGCANSYSIAASYICINSGV